MIPVEVKDVNEYMKDHIFILARGYFPPTNPFFYMAVKPGVQQKLHLITFYLSIRFSDESTESGGQTQSAMKSC